MKSNPTPPPDTRQQDTKPPPLPPDWEHPKERDSPYGRH